eukprot:1630195-Amphidinium_carterae.1
MDLPTFTRLQARNIASLFCHDPDPMFAGNSVSGRTKGLWQTMTRYYVPHAVRGHSRGPGLAVATLLLAPSCHACL